MTEVTSVVLNSSSYDTMGQKIFGEIEYHSLGVNRRQKVKVETELNDWIRYHLAEYGSGEIHYWVDFERDRFDRAIHCKIGILGPNGMWESSEYSLEPLRAFRKCLHELKTDEMSRIA
jgi:hypothetical protein